MQHLLGSHDSDLLWMAALENIRTIPAFSPGRIERHNSFGSIVDDVDKKVFRSRKNFAVNAPRQNLSRNTAVSRTMTEIPPAIVVMASRTPPCDSDFWPQATVQVLENLFDGIDEHVNVSTEVKIYNESVVAVVEILECSLDD